ncbi:hypothetical protein R9C00_23320 [Flammeovirgaceae bacterium SG7u.111]|nr:hypothetical protein [Flammeovirgaceae bacterium SG7u.132]WPO34637.1 hypothetical protein R9C00_23320 [Flammeovirgaceae bacterium SG7u.111]
MFLSLSGVQSLFERHSSTVSGFEEAHLAQSDSIAKAYEAKLEKLEIEKIGFEESVSWLGKIDVSNKDVSATLGSFTSRQERLEKEKAEKLAGLEKEYETGKAKALEESELNLWLWVSLSAFVEAAILACLWFLVYYAYRVQSESELFLAENQKWWVGINDLKGFADAFLANAGNLFVYPTGTVDSPSRIGFAQGAKKKGDGDEKPENTLFKEGFKGVQDVEKEREELRAFLAKYPEVVKCIEKGVNTNQTAKDCGVSTSTVHNVKRCLRTLKSYK